MVGVFSFLLNSIIYPLITVIVRRINFWTIFVTLKQELKLNKLNQGFRISLVAVVILCTDHVLAVTDVLRRGVRPNHTSLNQEDRDVSLIRLRFSSSNGSSDECVLHFYNEATNDYDWMYDALKMESLVVTAAECAFISGNNYALSIDSRPVPDLSSQVEIMADLPVMSNYTLQVIEASGLPDGFCFMLHDVVTGQEIAVAAGESLALDESGPYHGNRFILNMTKVVNQSTTQPICNAESFGEISFECESNDWIATLYQNGLELMQLNQINGAFSDLAAGVYDVVYTSMTGNCQAMMISTQIIAPQPIQMELLEFAPDHCNSSSDGYVLFGIENASEYNFELIDGEGNIVVQANSLNGDLLLESLDADIYTIEIDGLCGSLSSTFDLRDPLALNAVIEPGDINLLLSPNYPGNLVPYTDVPDNCMIHWYYDGTLIGESEDLTHSVSEPGNYELVLIAANGSCESRDSVSVEVALMTSIRDENLDVPFSVNLSRHMLTITNFKSDKTPVELALIDMQGRAVWQARVPQHAGASIEASFGNLPAGQYILHGNKSGRLIFSEKWIIR